MEKISIKTGSRDAMLDITDQVEALVPADMREGLCTVYCEHTTAAVTINENADPDVRSDIRSTLDRLIPFNQPEFRHAEGNSAAHLKSSMIGCSVTIPVKNGRLYLGRWQGIYFCEFDGPRQRTVSVWFIKGY
jgi:secondary thiamine-phosphate synthase enzyme